MTNDPTIPQRTKLAPKILAELGLNPYGSDTALSTVAKHVYTE